MNRQSLLQLLPAPTGREDLIAGNQNVEDIIHEVLEAHEVFESDYDLIAQRFKGGNVPLKLYNFCRENMRYKVEKTKKQTTRSPAVILEMGFGDCKHYAGFIAGVLDALNRSGDGHYKWVYRFGYYDSQEDAPGHVFVVVTDRNKEIWIDPVLPNYDQRYPAPLDFTDKKIPMSLVRMSGPCSCGEGDAIGNAESDLLNQLKEYVNSLGQSVTALKQTGQINQAIDQILQMAALINPYAAAAYAIAKGIQSGVHALTGPGSVFSRVIDASLQGNILLAPLHIAQQILGGRTYNTDQYYGASDYFFYVKGVDKGNSTNIIDADVLPAMLWYETKLGVFVSGRAHINALRQGPDAYLDMYRVNSYTTQDRVRVTIASQTVQKYMPSNGVLKYWANTVGVYDDQVTAQIYQSRIMDPTAQTDVQGTDQTGLTPATGLNVDVATTVKDFAVANPLVTAGIVAAVAYLLYSIVKD